MNKIFKVKRNAFGQSVVCSEITKSRTKGHIVASALAVAVAGVIVSGGAYALTALEGAKDTGAGVLAVGENADAVAEDAIAIGDNAQAIGGRTILWDGNTRFISGSIAIGAKAIAKQSFSIALGSNSINDSASSIAFGLNSYVKGRDDSTGRWGNNIAIGTNSQIAGLSTVIGRDFGNIDLNRYSENSTAIGYSSKVMGGLNALAIGAYSTAQGHGAAALGPNSSAKGNSAAIGYMSQTDSRTLLNQGYLSPVADGTPSHDINGQPNPDYSNTWVPNLGEVSIGKTDDNNPNYQWTRRVTNLAAGYDDTDAVNVAQLKAVEAKIGDSINYLSINKTADDDSSLPELDNFNNDGATGDYAVAIGAKSSATGHGAVAIGSVAKTINRTQTVASGEFSYAAQGGLASNTNSIAIGHDTQAAGIDSLALQGGKARGTASVAIGEGTTSDAANGVTIGQFTKNSGEKSVALGYGSYAKGNNSFTFGGGNYANDSILLKGTIQEGGAQSNRSWWFSRFKC